MGIFITTEGGEYTGKTTIFIPGLAHILTQAGIPVLVSREPGGSPEAERMRQLIFQKKDQGAPVEEITTLFFQARVLHVEQTIFPFLGKNKEKHGIVLLDRYIDSTRVYQGCEEGLPLEKIFALEKRYIQEYFPDITFLLTFPKTYFSEYLQVRQQLAHKEKPLHEQTKWDTISIQKHKQRQAYILQLPQIAQQHKEKRCFIVVDTSFHPHRIISHAVNELIHFIESHRTYEQYTTYIPAMTQALQSFPFTSLGKEMEHKWQIQQQVLQQKKNIRVKTLL